VSAWTNPVPRRQRSTRLAELFTRSRPSTVRPNKAGSKDCAPKRLHGRTCVRRKIASAAVNEVIRDDLVGRIPFCAVLGALFIVSGTHRELAMRDGRRMAQPEATPEPALATAHAVCRKRPSVVSLAPSSSTESVLIAWLSRLGPLGTTWRRTGKSGSCSSCALLWPLWPGSSDTTDYAGRDLGLHKCSDHLRQFLRRHRCTV
jgi:hypothetical protein